MFCNWHRVHPGSFFFFLLILSTTATLDAGCSAIDAASSLDDDDDKVVDDLRLLQTVAGRTTEISRRSRTETASASVSATETDAAKQRLSLLEFASVHSSATIVAPAFNSLMRNLSVAAMDALRGFVGNSTSTVSSGGELHALLQLVDRASGNRTHLASSYQQDEPAVPVAVILVVLCFIVGLCIAVSMLAGSSPRRLEAEHAAAQIARARGFAPGKDGMPHPSKPPNFGAQCSTAFLMANGTPRDTAPQPRLLPALMQDAGPGLGRQSMTRNGAGPTTTASLTPTMTHRGSIGPGQELCPELVVPYDRQCCVAVPSLRKIDAMGTRLNGRIADKQGRTILFCDLDCSGADFQGDREVICERLALRLPEDERLMAFADLKISRRQGTAVSCVLHGGQGAAYARVEEEVGTAPVGGRPSYLVRAVGDGALLLRAQRVEGGLGRASSSWVFTEGRGLTAASAWEDIIQDVEYARRDVHWVLVSSSVDVGIVVLSVMALDRMMDRPV